MSESSQKNQTDQWIESIGKVCKTVFDVDPSSIEFPGGERRKTAVVHVNAQSFAVSRRRSPQRAQLEAEVLRRLHQRAAPVPALVEHFDRWVIQEFVPGVRLSEALDAGSSETRNQLAQDAVSSLAKIHRAGEMAGLEKRVVVIGSKPGWVDRLIETPTRLSTQLGLPAPDLDTTALAAHLQVTEPKFIKWDARPGNAQVNAQGKTIWFDWEHCGCRNPLDDLAWFLCDEWSPFDSWDADQKLIRSQIESMTDKNADEKCDNLLAFGALHMCVRLALIISRKGDGNWWNRKKCLKGDKIGVTKSETVNLSKRLINWSRHGSHLAPLTPWILRLSDRLETGAEL